MSPVKTPVNLAALSLSGQLMGPLLWKLPRTHVKVAALSRSGGLTGPLLYWRLLLQRHLLLLHLLGLLLLLLSP